MSTKSTCSCSTICCDLTTSSYASGRGSPTGSAQADVQAAHLLHEGMQLRSRQRIVAAQINTLLTERRKRLCPLRSRAPSTRLPARSAAEIDAETIERTRSRCARAGHGGGGGRGASRRAIRAARPAARTLSHDFVRVDGVGPRAPVAGRREHRCAAVAASVARGGRGSRGGAPAGGERARGKPWRGARQTWIKAERVWSRTRFRPLPQSNLADRGRSGRGRARRLSVGHRRLRRRDRGAAQPSPGRARLPGSARRLDRDRVELAPPPARRLPCSIHRVHPSRPLPDTSRGQTRDSSFRSSVTVCLALAGAIHACGATRARASPMGAGRLPARRSLERRRHRAPPRAQVLREAARDTRCRSVRRGGDRRERPGRGSSVRGRDLGANGSASVRSVEIGSVATRAADAATEWPRHTIFRRAPRVQGAESARDRDRRLGQRLATASTSSSARWWRNRTSAAASRPSTTRTWGLRWRSAVWSASFPPRAPLRGMHQVKRPPASGTSPTRAARCTRTCAATAWEVPDLLDGPGRGHTPRDRERRDRVDAARRQTIGVRTGKSSGERCVASSRGRQGDVRRDPPRGRHGQVRGLDRRLDVDATGQPVRRGQTLFTLYSPELYAAQQEYLRGARAASARARADRRRPIAPTTWSTPRASGCASGTSRDARTSSASRTPASRSSTRRSSRPPPATWSRRTWSQGAAVEPGMRLFRIARSTASGSRPRSTESDLPLVAVGQRAVTLPYLPGRSARRQGRLHLSLPRRRETRTGRVRIELANPDLELKPDMYADVELRGRARRAR